MPIHEIFLVDTFSPYIKSVHYSDSEHSSPITALPDRKVDLSIESTVKRFADLEWCTSATGLATRIKTVLKTIGNLFGGENISVIRVGSDGIWPWKISKNADGSTADDYGLYIGVTKNGDPIYAFKDKSCRRKFDRVKRKEMAECNTPETFRYMALMVKESTAQVISLQARRPATPLQIIILSFSASLLAAGTNGIVKIITGLAGEMVGFCIPLLLVLVGFLLIGSIAQSLFQYYYPTVSGPSKAMG